MKKIFVLFLPMMFAANAHADLLLEPYIGYYMGKWKGKGSVAGLEFNESADSKGMSYGGRLGFQSLGLMLGLDYMAGKWKDDSDPKNDVTLTDLGAFVGYNLPVLLRVYAVYYPMSSFALENSGASNKVEGTGMKIGVGFTALPMVSINLEYMAGKYDDLKELKNGGADIKSTASDYEVTTSSYGLSVSLPLTF